MAVITFQTEPGGYSDWMAWLSKGSSGSSNNWK